MSTYLENLVCPKCRLKLKKEADFLVCLSCNQKHKIVNCVPDLREKDEYWCNVSRVKMKELNKMAKESGDWLEAAKKVVPQYSGHFVPFHRADCQFLWPTTKESVILDAGSMWGGITIPAAQYHKEVYAVDKTIETLEFLNIRAEQMGFSNIYPLAASLENLPFPDNFFDLVVLNGVLEWVGLDEDVVLEKQWQGTGRGLRLGKRKKYSENPVQMQRKVLREINRVLKPGGNLYLAIENRIGYIYLVGWPDEHMNLPFICFLPRFLANFITKLLLNSEYRTYVYTIFGYRSLLEESGFSGTNIYGAFNHYIDANEVIPLELVTSLKKKIRENSRWQLKPLLGLIPSGLLKYLSPSLICLAHKGSKLNHEARIKQIFRKVGVISGICTDFKAVKWDSRLGNDLPVNYLVYTDGSKIPTYFCKICRDKQSIDILKKEAENLKSANALFRDKEIELRIPKLVYFGTIDGVTILITNYLLGDKVKFFFWDKLKNLSLLSARYATKKWLERVNPIMKQAIFFLNDFQKNSTTETVNAVLYIDNQIVEHLEKIGKNNLLNDRVLKLTEEIREKVRLFGKEELALCLGHGDYDLCNILTLGDKINIVDFEHMEEKGLPFFDLGNLLFSPLVAQWKKVGGGLKLKEFSEIYGWSGKIYKWVKYYSEISGIPMDILKFLPPLVALEQNAKEYPKYRDPYTYPMYGEKILEEMLQWNL
ncbi:MAG: class I SAM-dependent methyltransferase [Candidatus Staskawiczbacteria bacterium]|jgi:ubiquinone/menaquinone biosynthesis C-methylase UbiE/uncharacterized protein YbaR (Trm112 family)